MFAEIFATGLVLATSFWTFGILALFILWLVHESCEGWAVFWLAVLGGVVYAGTAVSGMTALMIAGAWVPVGVCWSMYRWKRFCSDKVTDYNDAKMVVNERFTDAEVQMHNSQARSQLVERLKPSENISRLVNWIIVWPFSMLENVLGDIYDMIVTLVRKHLINVYTRITNSALKGIQ